MSILIRTKLIEGKKVILDEMGFEGLEKIDGLLETK
jgi:hypothetical protein